MSDEIVYVCWKLHEELSYEERMKRVAEGHHHDFHAELVECDEHGVPKT